MVNDLCLCCCCNNKKKKKVVFFTKNTLLTGEDRRMREISRFIILLEISSDCNVKKCVCYLLGE